VNGSRGAHRRASGLPLRGVAFAVVLALAACGAPPPPTAVVERRELRRGVTVDGHLESEKSTPITVPQEAEQSLRIEWLAAEGTEVAAGELVARFDASGFRSELERASGDREQADLRLAGGRAGAEASARRSALDAEIARSERELAERFALVDPELYSRHERIESTLDRDLAQAREEHAVSAQGVRARVARGETALVEIERQQASLAIGRAEGGLAALELRAPHAGLFVLKRDWRGNSPRPGELVWPGQTLAEIPDPAKMKAEVFVLEADAGGLAANQKATVWLESDPTRRVEATVARVDKVAKPRFRNSPVQYFGATLELATTDPARHLPGQRVRARIALAALADALVVPRSALSEAEGKQRVHVLRGGALVPLEVEVETLAGGLAAVKGAIEPGERVALVDPAARDAESDAKSKAATALPGGGR
jgi:HlyD family secretion protein